MSCIRRDWNEYWFSLMPATALGLFRILFGACVLCTFLLLAPDLRAWYSEQGYFTLDAMRTWNGNAQGFDLLALHTMTTAWFGSGAQIHLFGHDLFADVTDFRVTVALFIVLLVSALCVSIGYRTRAASIVMFVLLVSFHHRDMPILNGGDTLQRCMAFLLMFADAGAACSVDRLIRISRGLERASETPLVEAWPVRLMQIQLAVVYLTAVASKLMGPEWRDGTALYYALNLTDLHRFSLFGLDKQLWFVQFATYWTMATEFCMGALILVPRLRGYVLAMGVMLHLGIEYAMNVPMFAYSIMSCYLLFCPVQWFETAAEWIARQLRNPVIALPAALQPAGAAAELVSAMDVLHLVADTPSQSSGEELQADDSVDQSSYSRLAMRVAWRFPGVWALVFGPAMIVFLCLPNFPYASLFSVLWAVCAAFVIRRWALSLIGGSSSPTETTAPPVTVAAP